MTPTAQIPLIIRFRESCSSTSMSRDSASLKTLSGDYLKLAKQWYSILSEMMLFLNYCIFSSSAEALVRYGGKLQHVLIAYFLGDTYAKHYENLTMLSQVTAKNVGDVILRQMLVVTYCITEYLLCCRSDVWWWNESQACSAERGSGKLGRFVSVACQSSLVAVEDV